MNSIVKSHLYLLLTTLIGSLNYSIAKSIMPEFVGPSAIIIIRGIAATSFFWGIEAFLVKDSIKDKKDLLRLFLAGVFGISLNQVLFYEGLNLTTPINASLLQCGVPIFVMVIAFILAREKVTWIKILGLLLGGSGGCLLLLYSSKTSVEGFHWGDIMVTLNALSYAIFLVMVQPLTEKYDPFTVVKWVFLFGTCLNIPFGYSQFIEVDWNAIPLFGYFCLAYIVIFATIVNYYLNVGVLRYVNPSVAGMYIYLTPIFTSIIAIGWGKDVLTLEKLACSFLILGGVYLVSRKERNRVQS